jgi:hypothetical protein
MSAFIFMLVVYTIQMVINILKTNGGSGVGIPAVVVYGVLATLPIGAWGGLTFIQKASVQFVLWMS